MIHNKVRVFAGLAPLLSVVFFPYPSRAMTIGNPITANGYTFLNFDPALSGNAVGSNVNGISNTGQVVGTTVDVNNASTVTNFSGTAFSTTEFSAGAGQIAFGINSAGDIVGGSGTSAFFLPHGGAVQTLSVPGGASNAFGINDHGAIVGQFASGAATPGFYLAGSNSSSFVRIDAPAGPDTVNAQSVNNKGVVVGFYLGSDGQAHGLMANTAFAHNGQLSATAIHDPTIPPVPGEPGATFVFSQILGINDSGLAVGYYGDSTGSQHGFLYNLTSGSYSFLDDPAAKFNNGGVEVTQITGINNADQIAGFYTDSQGIAHSFTACSVNVTCAGSGSPVPEPRALLLTSLGCSALAFAGFRRRRRAAC